MPAARPNTSAPYSTTINSAKAISSAGGNSVALVMTFCVRPSLPARTFADAAVSQ